MRRTRIAAAGAGLIDCTHIAMADPAPAARTGRTVELPGA
jgi:hypothetical protein